MELLPSGLPSAGPPPPSTAEWPPLRPPTSAQSRRGGKHTPESQFLFWSLIKGSSISRHDAYKNKAIHLACSGVWNLPCEQESSRRVVSSLEGSFGARPVVPVHLFRGLNGHKGSLCPGPCRAPRRGRAPPPHLRDPGGRSTGDQTDPSAGAPGDRTQDWGCGGGTEQALNLSSVPTEAQFIRTHSLLPLFPQPRDEAPWLLAPGPPPRLGLLICPIKAAQLVSGIR